MYALSACLQFHEVAGICGLSFFCNCTTLPKTVDNLNKPTETLDYLDLDFSAITSTISIIKPVTKRINRAKGIETHVTTAYI